MHVIDQNVNSALSRLW